MFFLNGACRPPPCCLLAAREVRCRVAACLYFFHPHPAPLAWTKPGCTEGVPGEPRLPWLVSGGPPHQARRGPQRPSTGAPPCRCGGALDGEHGRWSSTARRQPRPAGDLVGFSLPSSGGAVLVLAGVRAFLVFPSSLYATRRWGGLLSGFLHGRVAVTTASLSGTAGPRGCLAECVGEGGGELVGRSIVSWLLPLWGPTCFLVEGGGRGPIDRLAAFFGGFLVSTSPTTQPPSHPAAQTRLWSDGYRLPPRRPRCEGLST